MEGLSRFFIRRWQFTLVLFGMFFALGVGALLSIPKSEDPIATMPGAGVVIILPGADAEQIERVITIPLEKALNSLEDVKEIQSRSEANVSRVSVEFLWGADPDKKYDEVVREVNKLRPDLPDGITLVRVDKRNPSQVSVVQMALVSETAEYRQIEAYARELRDEIERAPGVQQADLWGIPPSEVLVEADMQKLAAFDLPIASVMTALQRAGADIPLGVLKAGGRRLNIEGTGPFDTLDEIRQVPVVNGDGVALTVGDIADVRWSNDEQVHYARFNGERAVFLTARAKLGEDVFKVINAVQDKVTAFEPRLPTGISLKQGFNQADTVKHRLNGLGRDFLIAIALVLITLLPLGFRASLVVMIAIPLSISIGLLAIYQMGFTLNQLSIAGFVLSLGLLVDDSIVVVENITRHLREGMSRGKAAIEGVREINLAVVGCTAVLVLAFLPLMALPEATGEFIRSLPTAVVATVLASLCVSLTIIPFLASRILSRTSKDNIVMTVFMGAIHGIYRPILKVALSRPVATVVLGMSIFAASLTLVPRLGFSVFPENDSPYFVVDIELAKGSAIEDTLKAVEYADDLLAREENVEWRYFNAGRDNPQVYYNDFPKDQRSNIGQIYVRLTDWEPERDHKLLENLRRELQAYPGARFNIRRYQTGPPVEAPIAVRVSGADLEVLAEISASIAETVRKTDGTRNVIDPLAERLLTLDLNIDAQAAALAGVPAGAIDETIRIAVAGTEVAKFRDPVGDAYPVRLRGPRGDVLEVDDLADLYIWNVEGQALPLATFSQPAIASGPAQIDRYKRQRIVTVTAYTDPGFLTSRVTADVAAALEDIRLPPGYTLSYGGQAESQSESFSGLLPAIIIASFGIMAVLLLEFGSFATVAIVAFVIPMGIMGGLTALYIGGESLSFVAIIGFIALTGIEIKNSILLVDFANQERARGTPLKQAIERAGELRFLPVLLTALTAIGGLIPLVLDQSPLYSPLAMVIIGGLISSTLIGRIVTPPLYLLLAPKDVADESAAEEA
ncbi:MAG: multidrug transporter AcrB [Hirschia sp.]|nr:multidrug transporter AcrB [Hirschia sp.]MBF17194.1 multidrug transporter AcrB [Hirschia sp.]